MFKLSDVEEEYIKTIYNIFERNGSTVSTNAISYEIKTSAASVTDMLKKLHKKELIKYEKYKGVTLSSSGIQVATQLVRKYRVWKTFLFEVLHYSWGEINELADQLEHIKSIDLIDRIYEMQGNPKFDPHGDPIPDKLGKFTLMSRQLLIDVQLNGNYKIVGINNDDKDFLSVLDNLGISLGSNISIISKNSYDQSFEIEVNQNISRIISEKIAKNLFIKKI